MSTERKAAGGVIDGGAATLSLGGSRAGFGEPGAIEPGLVRKILVDTFRSPAISALVLGLAFSEALIGF